MKLKGLATILVGLSVTFASPLVLKPRQTSSNQGGQGLVTWDKHSFMIRGERLFLFSGEFHPFRLPVPGLWLDVFQKIKAMGFNGVSFYTDWGLLEANPGHVVTEGIWSLEEFFSAASEAGIYLVARPGPYINAETAAGGMPGWTLRINETLRSNGPIYEEATKLYMSTLGKIIAAAQITNGGPVIMVQPENEYTSWPGENFTQFPEQFNRDYMAFVEQELRDAGVVVPLINNDNEALGYWAPGTGEGSVQIYGIDAYPMRYDCADPTVWPTIRFPFNWEILHEQTSPTTPFAIPEFQGGSDSGWGPGSVNQNWCNALVNEESVRVLYKNNYSFGVKLMNIYMTFGGTNWGNLGYEGCDSSYDYGAAITEDRHVWREKYSEEKLEANFLKVSPAYLTATPGHAANGSMYVHNTAIASTPVFGSNEPPTNFYVVRHANFTSLDNTTYTLHVPTSEGNITVPQLGGKLNLNGRDSKIHVTDYDVGGLNLVYCTADITTWAKSESGRSVLVMYGGSDETHEFAFPAHLGRPSSDGESIKIKQIGSTWVVHWQVMPTPQSVRFRAAGLEVQMLWRNVAYNYWTLELPAAAPIGNYSSPSKDHVIVNGGYLMRTASIEGDILMLTGDLNATTDIELIFEPTTKVEQMSLNGKLLAVSRNVYGRLNARVTFEKPCLDSLPDLSTAEWKYIDSLPEIQSSYDDSLWTVCDHDTTQNDQLGQSTPTSLFATDYGYDCGSLIYRGHFTANGEEKSVYLNISGGSGHGYSAWLNSTFLGSWVGNGANQTYPETFEIHSTLESGCEYVITVLIDHMGQTEEPPGTDSIKFPFGILNYTLSGHPQSDIRWKMTGNLGGEQYHDIARGPRNEGAMYVERQGYILPAPPSADWPISSPTEDGLSHAGVGFYSTSFTLDLPIGYDVPLSFVYNGGSYNANNTLGPDYRVQLFVNGYQFGKYGKTRQRCPVLMKSQQSLTLSQVNNLGPQFTYPVPEGILNYNGINYVGITLWALDAEGAKLNSLELVAEMPVLSGFSKPSLSPQPPYHPRADAY